MTKQYLDLCNRILEEGVWVTNERTGVRCKTVINVDLVYDVGAGEYPLVTTRKAPVRLPIAELLGYIRGYSSAADFRALGSRSWDMNANNNEAWLANPHRKGEDDMGRVYGVIGNDFGGINQFTKVYENLLKGVDDRGEIITYWKPDEFDKGCLRPCLHSFQFSLLGDTLYLNATQRSCDVPLGLVANMQQCYWFLELMAHITGHKAGKVFHKIINAHIYENQIDLVKEQVKRTPKPHPIAFFNEDKIKTLADLYDCSWQDFYVEDYEHDAPINYPFSV